MLTTGVSAILAAWPDPPRDELPDRATTVVERDVEMFKLCIPDHVEPLAERSVCLRDSREFSLERYQRVSFGSQME